MPYPQLLPVSMALFDVDLLYHVRCPALRKLTVATPIRGTSLDNFPALIYLNGRELSSELKHLKPGRHMRV